MNGKKDEQTTSGSMPVNQSSPIPSPSTQPGTGDVGREGSLGASAPVPVLPSTPGQPPIVGPPPSPPAGQPPKPSEVTPSQEVVTTAEVSGGKKRFSKVYLIIIGIILLLGALGFLLWKFWPSGFLGLGKKGEITWWGLWEDEVIVASLIEEYQQQNPDVKITYIKQSPQDYRERLTNSLARGEGPDIFRFHNTWVPMFKNELDKVPASVMSSEEFSNIFYPTITSDLTSGSDLVGIPLGYDALTLYINEDIFAAAGKTPPQTWDDFRKLAIELTSKDDKGNIIQSGAAIGRTENVDHWPEILALMMLQNGVDMTDPTTQLAEDAIAFYKIFSLTDGIWDETLPPSTTAFANGRVAMYFGPTWRVFEIQQQNPELRFRTVSVPQLPKDTPNEPNVSYATYWVEGVWRRSTNKDDAWDFLKLLSTKESLEKLYQNASQTRLFGEPYPRADMKGLLEKHPIVGSVISLAPEAKSWYLVSRTFDGPTGINSQITQYFEDAVNNEGFARNPKPVLDTLASGVSQVLLQYGLIR